MDEDDIDFETNVFINCPLDDEYLDLLRPLLFTVAFLGYRPRIASERSDSLEVRLEKICSLISSSQFTIHDLSRLKASEVGEFSRMNMPFELGIEYGCRLFGEAHHRKKRCLILEKEPHDFKIALSDLAGVDIKSHKNEPSRVVRAVRNWFRETVGLKGILGPTGIWYRFNDFASDVYNDRESQGFSEKDLSTMPVAEYIDLITQWLDKGGR